MVSSNLTPLNDPRPQPSSIESEEAILSAIMLDGFPTLSLCMEAGIGERAFFNPAHRLIYMILMGLAAENKPLSMDVLAEELRKKNELSIVGGFAFLVQISQLVPTTAQVHYYIERVKNAYINRELIRTAQQVTELAYQEEGDVEKFTESISRIISIRHDLDAHVTIQEAATEAIETLQRIRAGTATEDDFGYSSPWAKFTQDFGEFQKGTVTILAARPNGGKSSMARQVCDHIATQFGNVMLFSREMMARELAPLFVQSRIGLSWRALRKGKLHEKEVDEFERGLVKFREEKRLHVFDRERTLSQLTARANAFTQLHDTCLMCIDYLQRYDPEPSKGESRDQAIGRMTSRFKDLAIDLKLPLLLLCQVGRYAEREKRPLMMSDLRESGNIEQDADRIIFLEVPETDPLTGCSNNPEDEGTTQIYVQARQVKGRGDGRASLGLYFNLPTTTFRSAIVPRQAAVPTGPNSSNTRAAHPAAH